VELFTAINVPIAISEIHSDAVPPFVDINLLFLEAPGGILL
jgi:hypothetical protein